jgi:hypothetical protein
MTGEQLGLAYQGLWNDIHGRGLKDLELCALGPDKTYYAKWRTGHWTANVSEEIKKVLVRAHKHGGVIKAIALGYGGSCVITWGKAEYTYEMLFETAMDLKGYYGNFNHQRWFRGAGITVGYELYLLVVAQADHLYRQLPLISATQPITYWYISTRLRKPPSLDTSQTTNPRRRSMSGGSETSCTHWKTNWRRYERTIS